MNLKFWKTHDECACENPAVGLGLLRLGVVLLFFVSGLGKLMDPSAFQAMLAKTLGLSGLVGMIAAWLVILVEVLGSIFVLLGSVVPKKLYKISLLGYLAIILVGMAFIHLPGGSQSSILSHTLILTAVLCLLLTKPMCPLGILGDNE